MPTITYSGSFGGVSGYGGITATLTGRALPQGALITNITYSLHITADGYSTSRDWQIEELSIGGSGKTPTASQTVAMSSRKETLTGTMSFEQSDRGKFASSIVVFANAYTTHPEHSSYLWEVSITVDYKDRIELDGFTDDPLVANETPIKALHMNELFDRVAKLRDFYNLSPYTFPPVAAGQTSLADWFLHVVHIRTALDEIRTDHDPWLVISENKPRADVMKQLRDVVMLLKEAE